MTDSEKLDYITAKLADLDKKVEVAITKFEQTESRVEGLSKEIYGSEGQSNAGMKGRLDKVTGLYAFFYLVASAAIGAIITASVFRLFSKI